MAYIGLSRVPTPNSGLVELTMVTFLLPWSSSSMEGAAGEATAGAGPVLPPRPAEFDDLFTDERWALMSEEARRAIVALIDEEQPCTAESRRLHDELFVGGSSAGFPASPLLLPDDFEGPMESLGRPWRIFTDPDAVRQVLDMADRRNCELQREKREAMNADVAADGEEDCYDTDDEGDAIAKRRRLMLTGEEMDMRSDSDD